MPASEIIAPLASSIVGGVVVALVNHLMTKRREHAKKLTELRIEQLIDCWRKLERGALVPEDASAESKSEAYDGFEEAIARVTLLGTDRDVEIAASVTQRLSEKDSGAIVDLLNELRSSLRRELGLTKVPDTANLFFRSHRDKK